MEKTCCLYYPYSRCLSVETLKKAVLLFDEIIFVDSQPLFIRQKLMRSLAPDLKFAEVEPVYRFLFKEGVAKLIDPQKSLRKFDTLLTLSIVNDINDSSFLKKCISESVETWMILRERLPPSFMKAFYPGAGTFAESISIQALIKANGDFNSARMAIPSFGPEWWNHAKRRWGHLSNEELLLRFFTRYRHVIGGSSHLELPGFQIPFPQASSLRINEALLISAIEGFTPFTDSNIHDQLLRLKINRTLKSLRENSSLGEKAEIKLSSALPQNYLSLSILDRLIPKEELQQRSVEDLVKFRRKNDALLVRFRERISELAEMIAITNMNEHYMSKVESLVSTKIMPEIRKIREELLIAYENNFGQLLARSVKVVVPTLIATIFAGLGSWEIIGACAIAETGVLSVTGADNLIEIWKAVRRSKRNGFAYLMKLES